MPLGMPVRGLALVAICSPLYASAVLSGCSLFDKTCDEDDRECIGPGAGLGEGLGGDCEITADCKEGLLCSDGECIVRGDTPRKGTCRLTAECGDDDYCGSARVCALAGNGGKGADCFDTSECRHGFVCEAPKLSDVGNVSLNDLASLSGTCEEGGDKEQGETCTRISDCLAGLYCFENPLSETLQRVCSNLPELIPAQDGELPAIPEIWNGITTCEPADEDAARTAVFEVPRAGDDLGDDFYALPFPNDIRLRNGRIDLEGHPFPPTSLGAPFVERYAEVAQEDIEGFSTNAIAIFRFSHAYDFDSVGPETVKLFDITPGSPEYNMDRGIEWKVTEGPLSNYVCPHWLGLRRPLGSPLKPSTTYAALVLNGIVDEDDNGTRFRRDDDFDAMLDSSEPSDPDLRRAWQAYQPLRDWIEDSGQNADAILSAAVFTTQDPELRLRALRASVIEGGVATVRDLTVCESPDTESPCYTETTNDKGEVEKRGACRAASNDFTEIHGRIRLPMFQQGTLPYLAPGDGGNIELDGDGMAVKDSDRDVCFAISVPSAAPPAGGYPVLVFSHGTGGSFNGTMGSSGFAQDMATSNTPTVVVAIDLPQHGDRRGDSTESPEGLFYNFLNPRAARDNVLQGSADILGVVRWVATGGLTQAASPTNQAIPLNPARVVVMGHSQGATHTALMTSYEPGAIGVVLSGVGGHLASSLLEKKSPVDIGRVIPLGLMDPDKNFNLAAGNFNPALAILQTVFDAVDPINYAAHLYQVPTSEAPQGQHAFVSYGLEDTYSPEVTQLAYALAGRLSLVGDVLRVPSELLDGASLQNVASPLTGNVNIGSTVRTVGMRQYAAETERDGMLLDGHFVAVTPGEDGYADVVRFLEQTLAGDQPQIGQ